jgi:pantoate--beta-alanine ligase
MKVVTSAIRMQRTALAWKQSGLRIGLVPTMGALHEGHLKLVDRCRPLCDLLVMSIYVNPTQFGPREDYRRYPRPRQQDRQLADQRGVDVLFRPANLYAGDASTEVSENVVSLDRCGHSRPGHFTGVATVVAKLFNIIQPEVAVFGQKDAQQCDVIERMARDLHFPVRILRAPIVRDKNGVALSSRNAYLSPDEYAKAVQFARILKEGARLKPASAAGSTRRRLRSIPGVGVDYVSVNGSILSAAVRIGRTRLIDNRKIQGRKGR